MELLRAMVCMLEKEHNIIFHPVSVLGGRDFSGVVITVIGDGYGLVQVLGYIEHLDVRTGDIQ